MEQFLQAAVIGVSLGAQYALLALGFWRRTPALRHAGMALVCLVVAKVFLVDMAGLQGLLRVLSKRGVLVVRPLASVT
mgnify:CR=1 FL=1